MVIKKVFKNRIFILFLFLLTGCKSQTYYELKDEVQDVKLIIRGPGTCAHMILFNQDGKGKIIRGRTLDSPAKDFTEFYDVEFLSYYKIDSKDELGKINDIIDSISKSNLITKDYLLDARRKEMFIKQEKKFDVYGWNGKKLIEFLKILAPHLPYDINTFCTTDSGITERDKLK